jgi:hypothetical protein
VHQAEEIEIGRSSQSSVLFVTSGLAHDEHSADDPHEPSALTRAERREVGRADRDTAFAVLDAGDGLEVVDLEGEAASARPSTWSSPSTWITSSTMRPRVPARTPKVRCRRSESRRASPASRPGDGASGASTTVASVATGCSRRKPAKACGARSWRLPDAAWRRRCPGRSPSCALRTPGAVRTDVSSGCSAGPSKSSTSDLGATRCPPAQGTSTSSTNRPVPGANTGQPSSKATGTNQVSLPCSASARPPMSGSRLVASTVAHHPPRPSSTRSACPTFATGESPPR